MTGAISPSLARVHVPNLMGASQREKAERTEREMRTRHAIAPLCTNKGGRRTHCFSAVSTFGARNSQSTFVLVCKHTHKSWVLEGKNSLLWGMSGKVQHDFFFIFYWRWPSWGMIFHHLVTGTSISGGCKKVTMKNVLVNTEEVSLKKEKCNAESWGVREPSTSHKKMKWNQQNGLFIEAGSFFPPSPGSNLKL